MVLHQRALGPVWFATPGHTDNVAAFQLSHCPSASIGGAGWGVGEVQAEGRGSGAHGSALSPQHSGPGPQGIRPPAETREPKGVLRPECVSESPRGCCNADCGAREQACLTCPGDATAAAALGTTVREVLPRCLARKDAREES